MSDSIHPPVPQAFLDAEAKIRRILIDLGVFPHEFVPLSFAEDYVLGFEVVYGNKRLVCGLEEQPGGEGKFYYLVGVGTQEGRPNLFFEMLLDEEVGWSHHFQEYDWDVSEHLIREIQRHFPKEKSPIPEERDVWRLVRGLIEVFLEYTSSP